MKAALISQGSKSSKMTLAAMRHYFEVAEAIDIQSIEINMKSNNPEVLYKGKPIEKFDCIYAKGSFRFAPILSCLTSILSPTTYLPVTTTAFAFGHDKLLTQLLLQQHQIPMPTTYLAATSEAAKSTLKKLNYPIVMKFPQGTQGKGVMFADSYSSASSMLDALTALKQPFLIQEYVETEGVDMRIIVAGDEVIAAMKRKSVVGEKRANIHAGGQGIPYEVDDATRRIAVNTAKHIGCDICAVDMLEGHKGPVVIEVNLSPGLQGITEATNIDVAGKIAQFLFEKTKSILKEERKESADELLKDLGIDEGYSQKKEIITNLDFRGPRILLPEVITKITKFNEDDEVVLKAGKDNLEISQMDMG